MHANGDEDFENDHRGIFSVGLEDFQGIFFQEIPALSSKLSHWEIDQFDSNFICKCGLGWVPQLWDPSLCVVLVIGGDSGDYVTHGHGCQIWLPNK